MLRLQLLKLLRFPSPCAKIRSKTVAAPLLRAKMYACIPIFHYLDTHDQVSIWMKDFQGVLEYDAEIGNRKYL